MLLKELESVEAASIKLREQLTRIGIQTERVAIESAFHCILAEDIISDINVPAFRRTAMDGYALRCKDVEGASEDNPVKLKYIGEVEMGKVPDFVIGDGECAYVPTGGMFPEGADGLVIIEDTDLGGDIPQAGVRDIQIEMRNSPLPGDNLVEIGEDMLAGELVLAKGCRIRAQEMGVLGALGRRNVEIFKPLTMSIISTGDELVDIDRRPEPGQVRDINSYTMLGVAKKHGIHVNRLDLLADDEQILEDAVREAMKDSDIVAISGGSSVGKKDATARIIEKVAKPGVFVHGIALKPGRPTILGIDDATKTLFVGVPGHPASAMISFEIIVTDTLDRIFMGGKASPVLIPAIMTGDAKAKKTRDTCITVKLLDDSAGEGTIRTKAEPLSKKSGAITMLSHADGYIIIKAGQMVSTGDIVKVRML